MRFATVVLMAPLLLACGAPCSPPAQSDDVLRVQVVDVEGTPLGQAVFALDGTPMPMICDDTDAPTLPCPGARWRQGLVGAHQLEVSAPGFAASIISVDAGSHDLCGEPFAAHAVSVTVQLLRE